MKKWNLDRFDLILFAGTFLAAILLIMIPFCRNYGLYLLPVFLYHLIRAIRKEKKTKQNSEERSLN